MTSCEIEIEGIGAARIVEKLVRGGVAVRAARVQKKGVVVRVDCKDREKVFAILRGSCYNGKKVRAVGAARFLRSCMAHIGLIAGALVFLFVTILLQGRVLRIDVVGSGAYYEAEVLRALAREGIVLFSPPPADRASIAAQILTFPRVSFCSLSHEGGVLTVRVEVSDEALPLAGGCLYAPADGVVGSLNVVAGTACVAVGDSVSRGDLIVENVVVFGEERLPVTAIASVEVRVAVDEIYQGSEEEALAQAYLAYGEIEGIHTQKTESGWRVTGEALVAASLNLG